MRVTNYYFNGRYYTKKRKNVNKYNMVNTSTSRSYQMANTYTGTCWILFPDGDGRENLAPNDYSALILCWRDIFMSICFTNPNVYEIFILFHICIIIFVLQIAGKYVYNVVCTLHSTMNTAVVLFIYIHIDRNQTNVYICNVCILLQKLYTITTCKY